MAEQPEITNSYRNGFSLIELIIVIVILGIISSIGSHFVLTAVDSYRRAEVQNKLVQRGRLSIEQITRELHMALPNAVRVSPSGDCLEFLPIVTSASYQDQDLTVAGGSIQTSAYVLGKGAPKHVIVAPFSSTDVYVTGSASTARATLGTLGAGPSYTSIPLSPNHSFKRNSLNKRVFIVDDPVRYCVAGGSLMRYSNYGFLTAVLGDVNPSGVSDIVSHEVSTSPSKLSFVLSPGSEDTNIAVYINLAFSKGTISIDLNHQVLIRNVP